MISRDVGFKVEIGPDGKPLNKEYFEAALPEFLKKSIADYNNVEHEIDLDLFAGCLNADINAAFVSNLISDECAAYLRDKYFSDDFIPDGLRKNKHTGGGNVS